MGRHIRTAEIIEKEKGKPIRDVLIDFIEREGNATKAAKALGVTQGAVSLWLRLEGLQLKTIAVPMKTEGINQ